MGGIGLIARRLYKTTQHEMVSTGADIFHICLQIQGTGLFNRYNGYLKKR